MKKDMEKSNAVRIVSDDENYIMNESPNNGVTIIPTCFIRCMLVSEGAKKVMSAILTYCYGGKKQAYPSHHCIGAITGLERNAISKYSKELKDKKFIAWEKRINSSNIYYLLPVSESPYIIASDIIWAVISDLQELGVYAPKKIKVAVSLFKKNHIEEFIKEVSLNMDWSYHLSKIKSVIIYYIKKGDKAMCPFEEYTSEEYAFEETQENGLNFKFNEWMAYFKRQYNLTNNNPLNAYKFTLEDRKHMKTLLTYMSPNILFKAIPLFLKADEYRGELRCLRIMQQQTVMQILAETVKGNFESVDDYLNLCRNKSLRRSPAAFEPDESTLLDEIRMKKGV